MRSDRNRHIEQRAYEIWEAEGRPHGKHDEHWHRAAQEIGGGRVGAGPPAKSAPASKAGGPKGQAKAGASAKKSGGAVSRTAKPAAAPKTGAAASPRRGKPAGTPSST
jgi:Protein of unknown function (DUF2934)